MRERFRAGAAALSLAVFSVVPSTLVLCDDGERHVAVESAMWLCCQQGPAGPTEATDGSGTQAEVLNRCTDSCIDTPLSTSMDVPESRDVHEHCGVVAPVALAPCSASLLAGSDPGSSSTPSPPRLDRSTVLRI